MANLNFQISISSEDYQAIHDLFSLLENEMEKCPFSTNEGVNTTEVKLKWTAATNRAFNNFFNQLKTL